MTCAYYNEHEPFAAQWLRNLIAANLIAPGEVDERSIVDVQAVDLRGFVQCHFFAGIGVWSLALRRAGWGDDRRVWTGSCPCQPFSVAGSQLGTADERHLWPEMFRLVRECRPPIVVGEQVAGPAALAWFDALSDDLEGEGYAVGAADLCAAGLGAPHIRQRLYWVAHRESEGLEGGEHAGSGKGASSVRRRPSDGCAAGDRLADTMPAGRAEGWTEPGSGQAPSSGGPCGMGDAGQSRGGRDTGAVPGEEGEGGGEWRGARGISDQPIDAGADGRMADADGPGQQREGQAQPAGRECHLVAVGPSPLGGFWSDADWLACTDGKARPVEPGTFPLAHGAPARVGRLRAYGNALCEAVAQEFVEALMECAP